MLCEGERLIQEAYYNVERVRQMTRGDRLLTVRIIASQLERKKDSVWKIIMEDSGISEK